MRPRILLADDHAMVAAGLGSLVATVADLVGQVNDGLQLVSETRRLGPDVVISDLTMPGMSGIDAMRELKAEGTTARFIFVTIHTEAHLAAQALRAGAAGYLLKHSAGEELIDAIRAVLDGRTYITTLLTAAVVKALTEQTDTREQAITGRQRDVLRLLAQGKRMKEIADLLGLSARTVEGHKYQLMQALGLESTADLVRYAIEHHIVPKELNPPRPSPRAKT